MPEWKAVALDDTPAWSIDSVDAPYIERMLSVYFFDTEERTCLCEAATSFYLRGLYCTPVLRKGTPEDVMERIYTRYCEQGPEDTYMHCNRVLALPTVDYGPVDEDTLEDDVREYWQGNCPF